MTGLGWDVIYILLSENSLSKWFEFRSERHERANHVKVQRQIVPDRGNSKCKGIAMGTYFMYYRDIKKVSETGV